MVFKISALDVDLVNLYNSVYLYFGSQSWQVKPAGPYPTQNIRSRTRLLDSSETARFALKIKSSVLLSCLGLLNGDFAKSKVSSGRLSMRSHFDLKNVASWIQVIPDPPHLPSSSAPSYQRGG